MRITPKALVTGAVTGLLAVGLVGSPAQAATKTDKKQNSAIKKTNKSVSSIKKADKKTAAAIKKLGTALGTTTTNGNKTSATLSAALPQVVTALTQLRDGLTSAGAGLTALKTALETQIAPGLTRVGDAVQSVEYGVVGVFVNNGPAASATVGTADIPDDGNTAFAAGSLPIDLTALTAAGVPVDTAIPVTVRGAIRSNEADGAATGDPAGQFGGEFHATSAAGALLTSCAPQATTPSAFTFPDGSSRNLPLQNIQAKAGRTESTKPDNTSTELRPGSTCTLPSGRVSFLQINAQFADFPTSTTPGPKD